MKMNVEIRTQRASGEFVGMRCCGFACYAGDRIKAAGVGWRHSTRLPKISHAKMQNLPFLKGILPMFATFIKLR
jgi:hypothetical protein